MVNTDSEMDPIIGENSRIPCGVRDVVALITSVSARGTIRLRAELQSSFCSEERNQNT